MMGPLIGVRVACFACQVGWSRRGFVLSLVRYCRGPPTAVERARIVAFQYSLFFVTAQPPEKARALGSANSF